MTLINQPLDFEIEYPAANVLGLELHLLNGELRFFDPQMGEKRLDFDETEHARQAAEHARQAAEQARQDAFLGYWGWG